MLNLRLEITVVTWCELAPALGATPGHRTITETGVNALSRYPVYKVENKTPYVVNSIEYHLPLDSV